MTLHGSHYVVRRHFFSVVELNTLAYLERPNLGILGRGPFGRQLGTKFATGGQFHQFLTPGAANVVGHRRRCERGV